jgi:hypothetical protein
MLLYVRLSISTCVMLICPQCAALASDMEQHLTSHQVSTRTVQGHKVSSNVSLYCNLCLSVADPDYFAADPGLFS